MSDSRPAFRTVVRGYDPAEVDRRIAELTNATVAAQQHASELHAELESLTAPDQPSPSPSAPSTAESDFASFGVHIGKILAAAREAAGEIQEQAEADAQARLAEIEQAATEARAESERQAAAAIETAEQAAERMLEDAKEHDRAAQQHAAELRTASERAREQAAEQAEAIVAEATSRADDVREQSQRELAVVTEHRDHVMTQLAALREALVGALAVGHDDQPDGRPEDVEEHQPAEDPQFAS
jgi:cell division septum initiation protein DivIVA